MDYFKDSDISYEPVGTGQIDIPATPPTRFPSQVSAVGIESIRRAKRDGSNFKQFVLKRTGGIALVRRPSMLSMSVNGQIPEYLQPLVKKMVMKSGQADAQKAQEEFLENGDPIEKMADLFRATAIAGFENPKLVPDNHQGPLPANTMYVGEIEIEDLGDYWQWCQGDGEEKAKAVASFPESEGESVSPGPRLQAVRPDAV